MFGFAQLSSLSSDTLFLFYTNRGKPSIAFRPKREKNVLLLFVLMSFSTGDVTKSLFRLVLLNTLLLNHSSKYQKRTVSFEMQLPNN